MKKCVFCLCDFETTGVDPFNGDLPIEVACIFTDQNFNIITTYESLIYWPEFGKCEEWPEKYQKAFEIHKIPMKNLKESKNYYVVANEIRKICEDLGSGRKPIILSDCGCFEFNFFKVLYCHPLCNEWPFHYCSWDTSLFLEITGIGDPKNVPHRAMKDVALLYKAIIRAADKIGYFNSQG
ncbi:MAG: exonuclease domain-containing protein [Atribacterota bacterium]